MKIYKKWIDKNCERLDYKLVIVTGASGSIGFYIAYYALSLGADVVLAVRNLEKGNKAKIELEKDFKDSKIYVKYLDVNKLDTIEPFINEVKELKPYILVNNAGIYHLDPLMNDNGFERTLCTNYLGAYILTRKILPIIEENKGKIIDQNSASVYFHRKYNFEAANTLDKCGLTYRYARTKYLFLNDATYLKNIGHNVEICHPGCSATSIFATSKGGFGKLFNAIIVPLMKIIFPSPSKAALTAVYLFNHNINEKDWSAPRGLFGLWGYPKIKKINKIYFKETKKIEEYSINLLKEYNIKL